MADAEKILEAREVSEMPEEPVSVKGKWIKGAENLEIAFLHPKSTFGVLTEICEDKNS